MTKDFSINIQKTVASLIKDVAPRNRDIIFRRFGLKNGKKETLESIGRGYGITRERVRQIEEFTLKQLSKLAAGNNEVAGYINWTRNFIDSKGGVMKEKDLFKAFSGQESDSSANASLSFVLSIDGSCSERDPRVRQEGPVQGRVWVAGSRFAERDPRGAGSRLVRFPENDEFYAFWSSDDQKFNSFKNATTVLMKALEKNGSVVPSGEFNSFAKKNSVDNAETCLSVSKSVSQNIFGQVGLVSWSEVKPRGVRDKAYMVLKRANSPKHFGEIARLINEVNFSGKKANVQTVHNELIKDSRFVLVGRGMYALSEWGYSAGTVKDVLIDILKKSQKPIPKALLVAKVKDARLVKENTILLNLQDSKTFSRKEDGTYTLRKA